MSLCKPGLVDILIKISMLSVLSFLYSSDNATDVNTIVAKKAIQAIGKIALRLPGRANACANKLLSLLATEISYVTSESLVSLASQFSIKTRN